jgi:hypothetical protein
MRALPLVAVSMLLGAGAAQPSTAAQRVVFEDGRSLLAEAATSEDIHDG